MNGWSTTRMEVEATSAGRRVCNAERSTTQPQVSGSADLAINKTDYSQSTNTYTRFGARDVTVSLAFCDSPCDPVGK